MTIANSFESVTSLAAGRKLSVCRGAVTAVGSARKDTLQFLPHVVHDLPFFLPPATLQLPSPLHREGFTSPRVH